MLASPPNYSHIIPIGNSVKFTEDFLSKGTWNSSFRDSIVSFLGYDQSSTKDVRINLVVHPDQRIEVELFEEPDKPFQKGFRKQLIPESEFSSTIINGTTVSELLADSQSEK